MNILFPTSSYYPAQIGGPSNTIYWHNKGLHKSGIKVKVITTNYKLPDIQTNEWLDTDHGKVIYCKTLIFYLPFNLIFTTIKNLREADIVHLNSLFYPASLTIALVSLFLKKKVVWSPRGELYGFALSVSKSRMKQFILKFIRLFLASKILFHGTNEKEVALVKSTFGQKTKVVNFPNYMVLPKKCKRDESPYKYLLFVGRLHPIKGIDNLIKSLAKLPEFKDSNYELRIVGGGEPEYVLDLKSLVKQNQLERKVKFLGHIEGEEKEQIYCDAEFLILPSHSENFGNVVIESLAQGTPVIASHGTPWQILEEDNAGFWTDNAPGELKETMLKAMNKSASEYNTMRQNSYKLAYKQFDVFSNINKWILVYQQLKPTSR